MAYASAHAAAGCDLSENERIAEAVEAYNLMKTTTAGESLSLEEVISLLDYMELRDSLLPQKGWGNNHFDRFLLLIAIVKGLSPWVHSGKTTAQVLAEQLPSAYVSAAATAMPFICKENDYLQIMAGFLEESRPQQYMLSNFEDFLSESLCSNYRFKNSFLEKATEKLFSTSIGYSQVTDIQRLMASPNGATIRKIVLERFYKSFSSDNIQYNWIVAAFMNKEVSLIGIDPTKNAVEKMIGPYLQAEDRVLGLSALSLLVWTYLESHEPISTEFISEKVINNIAARVKLYDNRVFAIAAGCLHDMILCKLCSPTIIDDELTYETAMARLHEGNGYDRLYAERLLTVMPWHRRESSQEDEILYAYYLNRLEKELQKEADCYDPEVSFATLLQLGYYNDRKLEKQTMFDRIVSYYKSIFCDPTQRARLRLINEQLD